ncbi:helix-turn-helix domain-containing protein [Pseudomonas sp. TE50-2]|uniref:MerR family transcriptional regulator n=1 Tax=Pseudomonas sp. TE50-2 TaxID=3142707 RepID=UPI003465799E
MSELSLSIGELAKTTQTKAVTIRYYEQLGLLPPSRRTAAGYRIYGEAERDRLLFVRRSRGLGFSLDDVRELLGFADHREASCAAVDEKVALQLEQVRGRIRDLRALERELERLLNCCQGGVIEECRIIESLNRPDAS